MGNLHAKASTSRLFSFFNKEKRRSRQKALEKVTIDCPYECYQSHFIPLRDGCQDPEIAEKHMKTVMALLESEGVSACLLLGFKHAGMQQPSSRSAFANQIVCGVDEAFAVRLKR